MTFKVSLSLPPTPTPALKCFFNRCVFNEENSNANHSVRIQSQHESQCLESRHSPATQSFSVDSCMTLKSISSGFLDTLLFSTFIFFLFLVIIFRKCWQWWVSLSFSRMYSNILRSYLPPHHLPLSNFFSPNDLFSPQICACMYIYIYIHFSNAWWRKALKEPKYNFSKMRERFVRHFSFKASHILLFFYSLIHFILIPVSPPSTPPTPSLCPLCPRSTPPVCSFKNKKSSPPSDINQAWHNKLQ